MRIDASKHHNETMDHYIKEIELCKGKDDPASVPFAQYTIPPDRAEGRKILPNLSKINIFVGENNSGKSKFLRHLAAINPLLYKPAIDALSPWNWDMVASVCSMFINNCVAAINNSEVMNKQNAALQFSRFGKFDVVGEGSTLLEELGGFVARLFHPDPLEAIGAGNIRHSHEKQLAVTLQQLAMTWQENIKHVGNYKQLGKAKLHRMGRGYYR